MIGIVLAAHGSLPTAFIESLTMILGDVEQVALVTLMPGDSLEELIDRIREAVQQVDSGEGVLIFLDLFGGTPANASTLLTQEIRNVYAVTGMNLPMLAEVCLLRQSESDVAQLAATAVNAGKTGIVDIVEAFNRFRRDP